ncbi:voltage-dependent calcium channel gamma-3 subunit [Crotalus adamanteus]|uniref:Voltage-dependent calcium channel gamma-3 subunit n=1 Tax=Crotalus adamanteus TaxID=8729 RepID=A0AAW1AV65_CROAD
MRMCERGVQMLITTLGAFAAFSLMTIAVGTDYWLYSRGVCRTKSSGDNDTSRKNEEVLTHSGLWRTCCLEGRHAGGAARARGAGRRAGQAAASWPPPAAWRGAPGRPPPRSQERRGRSWPGCTCCPRARVRPQPARSLETEAAYRAADLLYGGEGARSLCSRGKGGQRSRLASFLAPGQLPLRASLLRERVTKGQMQ